MTLFNVCKVCAREIFWSGLYQRWITVRPTGPADPTHKHQPRKES